MWESAKGNKYVNYNIVKPILKRNILFMRHTMLINRNFDNSHISSKWRKWLLMAELDFPAIFYEILHKRSQFNVLWVCDKIEKWESVMRNHTSLTTFILLGLTNNPQMQVLIFILLFVTYTLSITGNLIIIILTLVDSHLKSAIYFFLKNFFLETLFTTACIPRFLYSLSTGNTDNFL